MLYPLVCLPETVTAAKMPFLKDQPISCTRSLGCTYTVQGPRNVVGVSEIGAMKLQLS